MKTISFVLAMFVAAGAAASDVYFVKFRAAGRGGSVFVGWSDDIVFFNTGAAPAMVRFVGVSNGSAQADTPPLAIPAGEAVSLNATADVAEKWLPVPFLTSLWVLHLDVPPEVIAESRDEFYNVISFLTPVVSTARGKVSMPVFRDLVAAGVPQVHLGTDLSGNDSRVNVVIYNGGADTATATIEIKRVCDNTVMDSRTIPVPANTTMQVGNMTVGSFQNCQSAQTWERYTVVTVNQPSLSVVTNLNETLQPNPGEVGMLPIVGLSVR